MAAYLVGEDDVPAEAWERAHLAYLERDETPAAALIALWPLAYQLSKHPEARPAVWTSPIPAT